MENKNNIKVDPSRYQAKANRWWENRSTEEKQEIINRCYDYQTEDFTTIENITELEILGIWIQETKSNVPDNNVVNPNQETIIYKKSTILKCDYNDAIIEAIHLINSNSRTGEHYSNLQTYSQSIGEPLRTELTNSLKAKLKLPT